jgi:hypothetical protein
MSITNFLRRTAATLGAIAALTVTGAAAQTMTLVGASGNSCAFSTMSVKPDGSIDVNCSGGPSNSYTLAWGSLTSLTISTSYTTQIKVNRSSSSGDATIAFDLGGTNNCTSSTSSPISFVDGETTKNIVVTTTATANTTCSVTLQQPSAGTRGTPYTKSFSVTDPDGDVTFGFASPTSARSVAGGALNIVVERRGGTNNAYTVPYTLSGDLTASGAMIAGTGTVSGSLSFTGGSGGNQTDNITYTPPTTTPTMPALPANLVITLGTPSPTSTGAQTASIDPLDKVHTLTLNGPAVGCPAAQTPLNDLGGQGKLTTVKLTSGGIATFSMPVPGTDRTGKVLSSLRFTLSETTVTFPVAPWNYEIHVNKCRGLVQPSASDKCYAVSGQKSIFEKIIFTKTTSSGTFSTAAGITGAGYCYAPASGGPYYINIRYNYSACTAIGGYCGWMAQWQPYTY